MQPNQKVTVGPTSPPPVGISGRRVSSQMDAVMRLMTGKESRTIAEKLADTNRPSWDQYKKDNEDKLNISGSELKKMEEYRKQLDAEREQRLNRGVNHQMSAEDRSKKKKHAHKKHKRKRDSDDSSSSSSSSISIDHSLNSHEEEDGNRKRKKGHYSKKRSNHWKDKERRGESSRKSHHKKRSRKDMNSIGSSQSSTSADRNRKRKHGKEVEEENSDGDHYRLSTFFGKSSNHGSSRH